MALLFVIAIELLAQRIRRSKKIKGIPIDEHNRAIYTGENKTRLR